jgi:3-oxoacyl-[acyl-carrier protein] reductase
MQTDHFSLVGKSIIVTGAAQGIGRAIAQLALDLGATVTAVDLNAPSLQAFAEEAGRDRLLPMVSSVAEPDFASEVVAKAVQTFGAVHGLVNNAGICPMHDFLSMEEALFRRVQDVNVFGAFL